MRQPFPYPPIHHGEPLLRGIDPYLAYRKGPFVLQTLSESIGSDSVETALRRLLQKHPAGKIPLATTLELYDELKRVSPDSSRQWLHDMFEVNTSFQLRAERAEAKLLADSTWQVSVEVSAQKILTDEGGHETQLPLEEWIEIGAFSSAGRLSKPLYLQKHRITSSRQTIIIGVPQKPLWVGIDPDHIIEWEEKEDDDNFRRVKIDL
jgi:aminopeptidase N